MVTWTPKQFLMHVQALLDTVRQKGLDIAYDKACKEEKECIKRLQNAQVVLKGYKGLEEKPPQKRAMEKAIEATTNANMQLSLLSTKCSASNPTYSWRKLGTPGRRL